MATKVLVCPECESPLVPRPLRLLDLRRGRRLGRERREVARPHGAVVPPIVEAAGRAPSSRRRADRRGSRRPARSQTSVEVRPRSRARAGARGRGASPTPRSEEPLLEPDYGRMESHRPRPMRPPRRFPRGPSRRPGRRSRASAPAAAATTWPDTASWPPARDDARRARAAASGRRPAPTSLRRPCCRRASRWRSAGRTGPRSPVRTHPPSPKPSLTERLALGEGDGPLGLPATTPGRTIAVGATIAAFGFLLPWAEIVIGSRTMGGFLDQWGLAGTEPPARAADARLRGCLAVAHEKTPIRIGDGGRGDRARIAPARPGLPVRDGAVPGGGRRVRRCGRRDRHDRRRAARAGATASRRRCHDRLSRFRVAGSAPATLRRTPVGGRDRTT